MTTDSAYPDEPAEGDMGRTPPQDVAAEQSVLGGMMLSRDAIADVVEVLRGTDFYRPAHELVFDAVLDLYGRGEPADVVTVTSALTKRGELARVGGAVYLHECIGLVPTAANAGYYAEIVRERAVLRRLVDAGTKIVQLGYAASGGDVDALVDSAQAEIAAVGAGRVSGPGPKRFAEALMAAVDGWDKPEVGVTSTGWADLDQMLNGGWRPGHLTLIGARPAVGKSLLAAHTAVHAADHDMGVVVFSLEMSEAEMTGRATANSTGVDLSRIEGRALTEVDWQRVSRLSGQVADWPMWIDDRAKLSVRQVRAAVRHLQRDHDVPLVVIDYLQLMAAADGRDSRERQVSRIAEELKIMARELRCHVLALSQVNRGPVQRADKRPTMSDLRESGGLEAHADEVILLHRDDDESPGELELNVEKNRHGRTGRVVLAWAPHVAQARSMAREGWAS